MRCSKCLADYFFDGDTGCEHNGEWHHSKKQCSLRCTGHSKNHWSCCFSRDRHGQASCGKGVHGPCLPFTLVMTLVGGTVGKSQLHNRVAYYYFSDEIDWLPNACDEATIQLDIGATVELRCCAEAQHDWENLIPWLEGTSCWWLCYSAQDFDSLKRAQEYLKNIREFDTLSPIILVACQCDEISEGILDQGERLKNKENLAGHLQTSAKTGNGTENLLQRALEITLQWRWDERVSLNRCLVKASGSEEFIPQSLVSSVSDVLQQSNMLSEDTVLIKGGIIGRFSGELGGCTSFSQLSTLELESLRNAGVLSGNSFPALKRLDITSCEISLDGVFSALLGMVIRDTKLGFLGISDHSFPKLREFVFDYPDQHHLLDLLHHCPLTSLEQLEISKVTDGSFFEDAFPQWLDSERLFIQETEILFTKGKVCSMKVKELTAKTAFLSGATIDVDSILQAFPQLTHLDTSFSPVKPFSESCFQNATDLRYLDLHYAEITALPASFSVMKQLTYLNLMRSEGVATPDLSHFKCLQEVHLELVPSDLEALTLPKSLKILACNGVKRSRMPDLSHLSNLKSLEIAAKRLQIPLGNLNHLLPQLTSLRLTGLPYDEINFSEWDGSATLALLKLKDAYGENSEFLDFLHRCPKLVRFNDIFLSDPAKDLLQKREAERTRAKKASICVLMLSERRHLHIPREVAALVARYMKESWWPV